MCTFQDRRKRKRDRKSRHKRKTKSRGGRVKEIEDGGVENGKETAKSKHKRKARSRSGHVKEIEDGDVESSEEVANSKHKKKARYRGSRAKEIKDGGEEHGEEVAPSGVIDSDTNDVTMMDKAMSDDNKCDNQESKTIQKVCDAPQDASTIENCDVEMETNSVEDCNIVSTPSDVNSVIRIDDAVESELEDGEISDSSMSSSSFSSYIDSTTSADDDDTTNVASLLDAMEEGRAHRLSFLSVAVGSHARNVLGCQLCDLCLIQSECITEGLSYIPDGWCRVELIYFSFSGFRPPSKCNIR